MADNETPFGIPIADDLAGVEPIADALTYKQTRQRIFDRLREAMPAEGARGWWDNPVTQGLVTAAEVGVSIGKGRRAGIGPDGGDLPSKTKLLGMGVKGGSTEEQKVRDYYAWQVAEAITRDLRSTKLNKGDADNVQIAREALDYLDLRPYLQVIADNPDFALPDENRRVERMANFDIQDADSEGRYGARDIPITGFVQAGIDGLTQQQVEQISELEGGVPLDATVIGQVAKFDTTEAGMTPAGRRARPPVRPSKYSGRQAARPHHRYQFSRAAAPVQWPCSRG